MATIEFSPNAYHWLRFVGMWNVTVGGRNGSSLSMNRALNQRSDTVSRRSCRSLILTLGPSVSYNLRPASLRHTRGTSVASFTHLVSAFSSSALSTIHVQVADSCPSKMTL